MERIPMGDFAFAIGKALTVAAIRRDPAIAEEMLHDLRQQYGRTGTEQGKRMLEIAARIIADALAGRDSPWPEPPPGEPRAPF